MTRVNNFVENGGRLCRTLARSVSVDVDPNVQKKIPKIFCFFFGRLPRILPARENRISTQGFNRKWLGTVIRPLVVVLVCHGHTHPAAWGATLLKNYSRIDFHHFGGMLDHF